MQTRTACRKAFAKEDCSAIVAKDLIHKSAPIPMDYSVGFMTSFKREQERLLLSRGGVHQPELSDSREMQVSRAYVREYRSWVKEINADRHQRLKYSLT